VVEVEPQRRRGAQSAAPGFDRRPLDPGLPRADRQSRAQPVQTDPLNVLRVLRLRGETGQPLPVPGQRRGEPGLLRGDRDY